MNNGHKLIKQFNGHSGSQVSLKEWPQGGYYVEKIGKTERNYERLTTLGNAGYPVPKIYEYQEDYLTMEYLHGLDMKTYLIHNNTDDLVDFIHEMMYNLSNDYCMKDYTEVYVNKLITVNFKNLPFSFNELLSRLPKFLPQSTYHGDMTLENIMHTQKGFYLIDAMTTEYDSYIFDIAKMRQDLECKWFLRNSDVRLDVKLQNIQNKIKEEYPLAFDDSLLVLMLVRVLQNCEVGDSNYVFLMKAINRLWK